MTKSTNYYKIAPVAGNEKEFGVSKINSDLEMLDFYKIIVEFDGNLICTCPAYKPACKHKSMYYKMKQANKLDGAHVWDPSDATIKTLQQIMDM